MKRRKTLIFITISTVIVLLLSHHNTEASCHFKPDYEKADLSLILNKKELTNKDYSLLFYQTGLSPSAVDSILGSEEDSLGTFLTFQRKFFEPVEVDCHSNSILSKEERIDHDKAILAPYQDGDIIITNASHVLIYRNGHAGLIADADAGQTIEAAVMGSDSSLHDISDWRTYPNFAVLRLKGENKTLAKQVCETANEKLCGIPYRLTSGLFTAPPCDTSPVTGTQCAHLVWSAYYLNGIDLDSDGGRIVTPYDILKSSSLELVQIYGMNPSNFMKRLFAAPAAEQPHKGWLR